MLVLGHEASRSGGPLVLLDFLRWLKVNEPQTWDVILVLQRGGPLVAEFSELFPPYVLPRVDPHQSAFHSLISRKIFARRFLLRRRLQRKARGSWSPPPDLIY